MAIESKTRRIATATRWGLSRKANRRNRQEMEGTLEKTRVALQARSHEGKSEAASRVSRHRYQHELALTLEKARKAFKAKFHKEENKG